MKEMKIFRHCVINIYSNDEQVYTIDPAAEGKQITLGDEHHIVNPFIIYYLILGENLNHMEVVSPGLY